MARKFKLSIQAPWPFQGHCGSVRISVEKILCVYSCWKIIFSLPLLLTLVKMRDHRHGGCKASVWWTTGACEKVWVTNQSQENLRLCTTVQCHELSFGIRIYKFMTVKIQDFFLFKPEIISEFFDTLWLSFWADIISVFGTIFMALGERKISKKCPLSCRKARWLVCPKEAKRRKKTSWISFSVTDLGNKIAVSCMFSPELFLCILEQTNDVHLAEKTVQNNFNNWFSEFWIFK